MTRKMVTIMVAAGLVALVPLALLRPVALAQTSASLQLPIPSNDEQTTSSGTLVKLVGMTEAGTSSLPTRPWWNASGQILPHPLLRTSHLGFGAGLPSVKRVIAFRISSPHGLPVTTNFQPLHCISSSSDGVWTGKITAQAHMTEAQMDAQTGGYRCVFCAYPVGATTADIRVGIGDGPWKTGPSDTDFADGSMSTIAGSPCIFSPITPTLGGSVITISLSGKEGQSLRDERDLRVAAIDRHGRKWLPSSVGDNSSDSISQIQARFALPAAAIQSVQIETRPYHWLNFQNIALDPVSAPAARS